MNEPIQNMYLPTDPSCLLRVVDFVGPFPSPASCPLRTLAHRARAKLALPCRVRAAADLHKTVDNPAALTPVARRMSQIVGGILMEDGQTRSARCRRGKGSCPDAVRLALDNASKVL